MRSENKCVGVLQCPRIVPNCAILNVSVDEVVYSLKYNRKTRVLFDQPSSHFNCHNTSCQRLCIHMKIGLPGHCLVGLLALLALGVSECTADTFDYDRASSQVRLSIFNCGPGTETQTCIVKLCFTIHKLTFLAIFSFVGD